MSKRAFARPRHPSVLAHQRPSFSLPQRIAFGLSFSHGRMAIQRSTEFRSSSTYSTSSNFFRQAVLKRSLPLEIVIAGFCKVAKYCARTTSYPLRSKRFMTSTVSCCFSRITLSDASRYSSAEKPVQSLSKGTYPRKIPSFTTLRTGSGRFFFV